MSEIGFSVTKFVRCPKCGREVAKRGLQSHLRGQWCGKERDDDVVRVRNNVVTDVIQSSRIPVTDSIRPVMDSPIAVENSRERGGSWLTGNYEGYVPPKVDSRERGDWSGVSMEAKLSFTRYISECIKAGKPI